MKMKKILAASAVAALVIGIGATGKTASAQQQDSEWNKSIGTAVTNAVLAQVQQEMANVAAQVASTTSAAVAQRVDAKIQARLAAVQERLQAAQERALIRAEQQAETPRARIIMSDGDDTGWLGVTPEDVSADRAKELKLSGARGVYISEVEPDSPAEKAGLKSGDVITEFNGQHVEGAAQFRRLVRETPAGRSVAIVISRDGKSQTINATLSNMSDQFERQFRMNLGDGRRALTLNAPNWEGPEVHVVPMPAMPAMPTMPPGTYSYSIPGEGFGYGFGSGTGIGWPTIGISGENLSGQLGTYFGAPDGEGVLVREVESGSPAEKGGLKAGDVITKVAGERVKTLRDMQSKLREKREDKTVQITVVRHGSETTLTVEPNKPKAIAPTRPGRVA